MAFCEQLVISGCQCQLRWIVLKINSRVHWDCLWELSQALLLQKRCSIDWEKLKQTPAEFLIGHLLVTWCICHPFTKKKPKKNRKAWQKTNPMQRPTTTVNWSYSVVCVAKVWYTVKQLILVCHRAKMLSNYYKQINEPHCCTGWHVPFGTVPVL